MSALFPNKVSVLRQSKDRGVGSVGYGGLTASDETLIRQGVQCSVQFRRSGSQPVKVPGATQGSPFWDVMIPKGIVQPGEIHNHDVLQDEQGRRFQVVADYWHPMGYSVFCQRLEP